MPNPVVGGSNPLGVTIFLRVHTGHNERFNGSLRNEVLKAEWCGTTIQARIVINIWLKQYNHIRKIAR
ncbi:MAG: integrase core domain-containing protein [Rhizobiaceae bacterium]